jgi:hypothetical protein
MDSHINYELIKNFMTISGLLAGFSLTIVVRLLIEGGTADRTNQVVESKPFFKQDTCPILFLLLASVLFITVSISSAVIISIKEGEFLHIGLRNLAVNVTTCGLAAGLLLFFLGTVSVSYRSKKKWVPVFVGVTIFLSMLWLVFIYFFSYK